MRTSRLSAARAVVMVSGLAAGLTAVQHAGAQCGAFSVGLTPGTPMVTGTVDTGNHCDDCTTGVNLPFPVTLYGVAYTTVNVSSNGNAQFTTGDGSYTNECLPAAYMGVLICPHWDDLRTDETNGGIYTSVSGTAPNRVFNIEWRATYYGAPGSANFVLRLFEDASRFEVIYGATEQQGGGATVGVQHPSGANTQYSCNAPVATQGSKLTFTCSNESSPPSGVGSVNPNAVYACGAGETALFTVNATPGVNPPSAGLTATANFSTIGGSAAQAFYNDGTHGDAVAGDTIHSYAMTVTGAVTPGTKVIPFTVSDAQGRSSSGAVPLQVQGCPATGPDVFVVNLTDIGYYGTLSGISAYAIGTDACNQGDVPVQWIQSTPEHPLIAQNLYRLKGGRFEQIGQSWLKHAFQSLNSPGCLPCQQPPLGGAQLGIGCSDVYGSGYNGGQGGLGPRSEVNPTTGAYPYPFGGASETNLLDKRLQVKNLDLDPVVNAGALYFAEAQYITADDARWSSASAPATNGLNNASYQRVSIPTINSIPALVDVVHRQDPAIRAWKDNDPSVSLAPADYIDNSLGGAGIVARFWVAGKASQNLDGSWHYEYAVHNLNSDRCAGRFTVPARPGVIVSNIGFHGIFAHTGEPYPNTSSNPAPWAGAVSNYNVTWACAPFAPPRGDTSNALRWGTMYNFRFDSNAAPAQGDASVGLFKPGTGGVVTASGIPIPGVPPCPSDYNSDGGVDGDDVIAFFGLWDSGNMHADINTDGGVDGDDVIEFFSHWDQNC